MKKIISLLILVLLVLLIILQLAIAQEQPPGMLGIINPEKAEEKIEKVGEITEKIQDTNYLQQEWAKLLEKNKYFGPALAFIDEVLKFLNPFFKIVLGIDYALSWAFIISVLIWFILFFFLLQPSSAIFNGKLFGFIASFVITSLIGISGVIEKAVDLVSTILTNKWLVYISLAVTLIIGFIIVKLGGGLKQMLEKQKAEAAKIQEERDREVLHTGAEVVKKEFGQGGGI